jgi:hypothetical protein
VGDDRECWRCVEAGERDSLTFECLCFGPGERTGRWPISVQGDLRPAATPTPVLGTSHFFLSTPHTFPIITI